MTKLLLIYNSFFKSASVDLKAQQMHTLSMTDPLYLCDLYCMIQSFNFMDNFKDLTHPVDPLPVL